jgi:hypothetical protein
MATGHEMAPTLWRTCRVLANPKRLALIGALIGKPPQTVGAVAASCGLSGAACSLGLRQIQARGLCRATRTGRWVSYALEADPRFTSLHRFFTAVPHDRHSGMIAPCSRRSEIGRASCRERVYVQV